MQVKEFLSNAENIYHKYFPHSKCWAAFDVHLYRSISIKCYLANKKEECPNNYWENDMLNVLFFVQTNGNMQFQRGTELDSELPTGLQIESSQNSYSITPEEKYMAFGRTKVPFRKTKGTPEKILSVFDKFCERLKDSIVKDYLDGKVHKEYLGIVNSKLMQWM